MAELAPVCLFVYKRLEETIKTVNALQANFLAPDSDLIVFSDAARRPEDIPAVRAVRDFLAGVGGFKTIKIVEAEANRGLARSIIGGVSEVVRKNGKVIVLEDDLITSPNFLDFMNSALDFYEDKRRVFAISGYSYELKSLRGSAFDSAFGYRSYSWGWATWIDRWELVDWEMKDYPKFISEKRNISLFNRGGSDLSNMLSRQMAGSIDSWMIRWVYAQHKNDMLDVFPRVSKIQNVGFGGDATHTQCSDRRYRTPLDTSNAREFGFDPVEIVNPMVQRELVWLHSYVRRGFYKVLNKLPLLA